MIDERRPQPIGVLRALQGTTHCVMGSFGAVGEPWGSARLLARSEALEPGSEVKRRSRPPASGERVADQRASSERNGAVAMEAYEGATGQRGTGGERCLRIWRWGKPGQAKGRSQREGVPWIEAPCGQSGAISSRRPQPIVSGGSLGADGIGSARSEALEPGSEVERRTGAHVGQQAVKRRVRSATERRRWKLTRERPGGALSLAFGGVVSLRGSQWPKSAATWGACFGLKP